MLSELLWHRDINKMIFECHYCPAVYPDLKGLIEHFEVTHRNKDEYIEFEIDKDKVETIREREDKR